MRLFSPCREEYHATPANDGGGTAEAGVAQHLLVGFPC